MLIDACSPIGSALPQTAMFSLSAKIARFGVTGASYVTDASSTLFNSSPRSTAICTVQLRTYATDPGDPELY